MFRHDRILLAIAGLLGLALCLAVAWDDATPGYASYQTEFRRLVEERFGPERAAAVPSGLQQIWLSGAARVDRCTSCHMGVTWQGLEDAPEPFKSHPKAPLAHHPVERFGCTFCHGGQGYATALPDLTRVGEKGPEQYDYSRLEGTSTPTLLGWHIGHLQSPKSYSPETVMPDFGFNAEDAQAIALILLSWRDADVPADLLPGAILRDVPTPEEAERERIMREGEGRFFVEKGCFICHDVSSFGIVSATKIGPDLAIAVEDAPRRFGRTLDDFLMHPSGTMEVVLSKQIPLTEDERRQAIGLLKKAYEKHMKAQGAQDGGKR